MKLTATAPGAPTSIAGADRIQVRYTCEDLDLLRRRLHDLERDIERLLDDHEVGRLLTTIQGIGPQTSARLVATFGDFTGFRSGATLASYVGAILLLGSLELPRATSTVTSGARAPRRSRPRRSERSRVYREPGLRLVMGASPQAAAVPEGFQAGTSERCDLRRSSPSSGMTGSDTRSWGTAPSIWSFSLACLLTLIFGGRNR
jgi:hypothetical protein